MFLGDDSGALLPLTKCSWASENVNSTYEFDYKWTQIDHFVARCTFKAFRGVSGKVSENVNSTYEFDCGWAQIDHSVAKGTFLVSVNTFDIGHYGLRRETHAA